MAEDIFIETFTSDRQIEVPSSVSRRYAYMMKVAHNGGDNMTATISQIGVNTFSDILSIEAGKTKMWGGNPSKDRLYPFDAGGTIDVSGAVSGSVAVTLGFVDLD